MLILKLLLPYSSSIEESGVSLEILLDRVNYYKQIRPLLGWQILKDNVVIVTEKTYSPSH